MGEFDRKMNEDGEPKTTAERELQKLLGEEGVREFNHFFPQKQVQSEHDKAKEWDEWEKENALQAEVELSLLETLKKAKEQLLYLGRAVNYLQYCRKAGQIPDEAKFSDVFVHIGGEAQKLASQHTVINDPNNYGVLATLKALIDLKREEFPENTDLLGLIKQLSDRFDNLKKATAQMDGK